MRYHLLHTTLKMPYCGKVNERVNEKNKPLKGDTDMWAKKKVIPHTGDDDSAFSHLNSIILFHSGTAQSHEITLHQENY